MSVLVIILFISIFVFIYIPMPFGEEQTKYKEQCHHIESNSKIEWSFDRFFTYRFNAQEMSTIIYKTTIYYAPDVYEDIFRTAIATEYMAYVFKNVYKIAKQYEQNITYKMIEDEVKINLNVHGLLRSGYYSVGDYMTK